MDSSNFRKRVLHKLAEELELPKLTFQVIRRTIATLGKTKGHVKDIQGMLRHSKASTTTDVYMQSLEGSAYGDQIDPRRVDGYGYYRTCSSGAVGGISDLCGVEPEFGDCSTEGEPGVEEERFFRERRDASCEACQRSGFGICDKDATKSRKGGASK
jgi:hypothetical protein